jgi:A/G-specific adenine glycosylase
MIETRSLSRRSLNTRLLRWHAGARRPLAIREATTPWQVFVAEVMSQQTGIERVGPIWRAFVHRWPTPSHLADATTRDVLGAWSGLGYNRRALALRESARLMVETHDGRVPSTVVGLEALPGIGPYTARAVAASAFGVPVAPLDVNVRRVVTRVTGIDAQNAMLQEEADRLVPRQHPGRWVDAVMDLAASTCLPRDPICGDCPVAVVCASRGTAPAVARNRTASGPFPSTRRWLRGRLVALFLDAPADDWVELPDGLGSHDAIAVRMAVETLAVDGFVELTGSRARIRPIV